MFLLFSFSLQILLPVEAEGGVKEGLDTAFHDTGKVVGTLARTGTGVTTNVFGTTTKVANGTANFFVAAPSSLVNGFSTSVRSVWDGLGAGWSGSRTARPNQNKAQNRTGTTGKKGRKSILS